MDDDYKTTSVWATMQGEGYETMLTTGTSGTRRLFLLVRCPSPWPLNMSLPASIMRANDPDRDVRNGGSPVYDGRRAESSPVLGVA